jgi:hypothetical protein
MPQYYALARTKRNEELPLDEHIRWRGVRTSVQNADYPTKRFECEGN